jgi:hypothetical protein
MTLKPSITALFLFGLFAFPYLLNAQNVTWVATGLPPGMTISTVNGSNGVISGTPTSAGNYTAVIYPKVGSLAGDQTSVPITVLPSGIVFPPTYYSYSRIASNGAAFNALAGGGGAIFGYASFGLTSIPFFTTNGTTFNQVTLPIESNPFGNGVYGVQALMSGSSCLILGNGVLAESKSQGSFKSLSLPTSTNFSTPNYMIAANGTNGFFCVSTMFNQSKNIQIYSLSTNSKTWVSRGSFASTNRFLPSVVATAVNGNFVVMSLSAYQVPDLLLYSTNGGNSWTVDNNNPGLLSLAYGNGKWVGSGNNGVYSSSNGIKWTQISSIDVGSISFSPKDGYFFSANNGASSNGIYWTAFQGVWGNWGNAGAVSSGTGLLFFGSSQLSTNFIPSFYASSHQLTVGKATNITIPVDSIVSPIVPAQ